MLVIKMKCPNCKNSYFGDCYEVVKDNGFVYIMKTCPVCEEEVFELIKAKKKTKK